MWSSKSSRTTRSRRQTQQVIFKDQGGSVHHANPRYYAQAAQLRPPFDRTEIIEPYRRDAHCLRPGRGGMDRVALIKAKCWPRVTFSDRQGQRGVLWAWRNHFSPVRLYHDRYFRAIFARLGFHYFLTQFSEYTGDEPQFTRIREFICSDSQVTLANQFIGGELTDASPRFAQGGQVRGPAVASRAYI